MVRIEVVGPEEEGSAVGGEALEGCAGFLRDPVGGDVASWPEYRAVVFSIPTAWISTATILLSSEKRKNGSYFIALSPEKAVKSSTAVIEDSSAKGEE